MNLNKLLDIKRTITVIREFEIKTENGKIIEFGPLDQFDLLNFEIKKQEIKDGPVLIRVKKIWLCLSIYSHKDHRVYKFNTCDTNDFKEIKNFIALQKYINKMFELVLKKKLQLWTRKKEFT